jgi:hypothetical protein
MITTSFPFYKAIVFWHASMIDHFMRTSWLIVGLPKRVGGFGD